MVAQAGQKVKVAFFQSGNLIVQPKLPDDRSYAQRRVAYPCLKARKARCLRNTEVRAMQRKQG